MSNRKWKMALLNGAVIFAAVLIILIIALYFSSRWIP